MSRFLAVALLFMALGAGADKISMLEDLVTVTSVLNAMDAMEDSDEVFRQNGGDLQERYREDLKALKALSSNLRLNDPKLAGKLKEKMAAAAKFYRSLLADGNDVKAAKRDAETYARAGTAFNVYMQEYFRLDKFIRMTEEDFRKAADRSNYVGKDEYFRLSGLVSGGKFDDAFELAGKLAEKAPEFQETSVYLLERADILERHSSEMGRFGKKSLSNGGAARMYLAIVRSDQYSHYLSEAWLKWRTVYQRNERGSSHMSEIPNDEYDKVRYEAARIVLRRIRRNPDDEMAVNQLFYLCTYPIIKAYGAFQYGNDNVITYAEIFGN